MTCGYLSYVMASVTQKKAGKKKEGSKGSKRSAEEIALEQTLKRGAELDEDNPSSSSSSIVESESESSAVAKEAPAKGTSVKKKGCRVAKPRDKSGVDQTVIGPASGSCEVVQAIQIPCVEAEDSSSDEVADVTPSSRQSDDHKASQQPATSSVSLTDNSPLVSTPSHKPQGNQERVKKPPVAASMQRRRSSFLHKAALSRTISNLSMGSTIQEQGESEIGSVADAAKAMLPSKPKMTGDNLPKMVDFLPDIRARIEMLKKPSKGAKNKKKVDEQAENQDQTGGEGEIYGEFRNPNKPKKALYGIGKNGVERALVIFREKPQSRPLDVYFDFPNSSLTHAYVYNHIKQQLTTVEGAKVVLMQYQDRNVLFGARCVENRWIIRVNSVEARDELIKLGLVIFNRKIRVRKYDEAVEEDYQEFLKNSKLAKNINFEGEEDEEEQPATGSHGGHRKPSSSRKGRPH